MSIKKLQALRAKKGFTLVELIVVIAIIAILAAILIPMLVNHIRSSACTRSIGDAKTAAGVVSAEVSFLMTRGSTFLEAEGPAKTKGEGIQNVEEVTITEDYEYNIVVIVKMEDGHGFQTIGGSDDDEDAIGCDWPRCPGNRGELS